MSMEEFDFTWNYRIVNCKSDNGGEDWYSLQEVHYEGSKPRGYGAPCNGVRGHGSLREVWKMINRAMELPPLQEEDFKKDGQNEEK